MTLGRRLLVEGAGDWRVIEALARKKGIELGKDQSGSYPIPVTATSMPALVESEFLATWANASGLEILGLVLDADENPVRRLELLRRGCEEGLGRRISAYLPADGLILQAEPGKPKFGIWMMPDNSSRGMLETFLAYLVPRTGNDCWEWTQELCDQASAKGATFKEAQRDKARIHAYLAFQDEPGRQLHEAVINRILDPDHEMAKKFLSWFSRLFELTPSVENSLDSGGA